MENVLRQILVDFKREVEPRLDRPYGHGGYDCCGCATYGSIYDDMVAIVESHLSDG